MELKDQTNKTEHLDMVKKTVCEYYDIDPEILNTQSRKYPIPYLKKIINHICYTWMKIPQDVLGDYWNQGRSNVSTHVKTFKQYLDVNERLRSELKDIERILSDRGIVQRDIENRRYYSFVDLDNTIHAQKSDQHILFVGMEISEIKKLIGEDWKIEIHINTGKIFYNKINKNLSK